MKLAVRHATTYTYEASASRASMLLKLKPRSFEGHRVETWEVTVNDTPVTNFIPNGYGDLEALWNHYGWLEAAEVVATGIVETENRAGVVRGLEERMHPAVYLRETPLTRPSPAIVEMARETQGEDQLERLHRLSAAVRGAIDYRAGVTGVGTSAAEALELGSGVCQDHAHVFLAALRSIGVPARYVTGYLLAAEEAYAQHETHAWVEAQVKGLGWVGFDVSNQVSTTDYYVRLAGGVDAHDAAPIRGSAVAAGTIVVGADVRIDRAGEGVLVQQLQEQQQQQLCSKHARYPAKAEISAGRKALVPLGIPAFAGMSDGRRGG